MRKLKVREDDSEFTAGAAEEPTVRLLATNWRSCCFASNVLFSC